MTIFRRSVPFSVIGVLLSLPAYGQSLSPDATVGTQVAPTPSQFVVTGGTERNGTLFHSFETFSPQDASVLFQLSDGQSGVNFVVGRVTGLNSSLIDGRLELTGGDRPDLFLINPNGFIFGPNARLDLPGSFLASTADSVLFDQGLGRESQQFSATTPSSAPLLTLGIPTGLQMGQGSGIIEIQGQGHGWQLSSGFDDVLTNTDPDLVGLQVQPGHSFALVGQDVNLIGGVIKAPGAQVELVAVGDSLNQVDLQLEPNRWRLFPRQALSGDLTATQTALIQAGGTAQSSLRLQGGSLSLSDRSMVLSENNGVEAAQPLMIQFSEQVNINGKNPQLNLPSGLYSIATGEGQGSDLNVQANQVQLNDGGNILAETSGSGDSGQILLRAQRFGMNLDQQVPRSLSVPFLRTRTISGNGNSGDVKLDVEHLTVAGSGVIAATSSRGSRGNSGNILVNAKESIDLSSDGRDALIAASAIDSSGDSGDIMLNTSRLTLQNGALVSSSTFGLGAGGSINIAASEFIELEGRQDSTIRGISEGSGFRTAGVLLPPRLRGILRLPEQVAGDAGDINVTTPMLSLRDGAEITVRHDSVGDAGSLSIQADSIQLENQARLSAETALGNGGNIRLNSDLVSLIDNSSIATNAGGIGSGGDISVNSALILGVNNSDIVANAVQGQGGKIQIEAQSLIGFAAQPQRTIGNDITASSELGINGTVAINILATDDSALGQVKLPKQLLNESQQIAQECDPSKEIAFRLTGRGGLPATPVSSLAPRSLWADQRAPLEYSQAQRLASADHSRPIEALAWQKNSKGQVRLITLETETGGPELPIPSCGS